MAEHPLARPPRPLDPARDQRANSAAGAVAGPDDEAPEDPAAKALTRGCLRIWLIIGAIVGTVSLIYWLFFAT